MLIVYRTIKVHNHDNHREKQHDGKQKNTIIIRLPIFNKKRRSQRKKGVSQRFLGVSQRKTRFSIPEKTLFF